MCFKETVKHKADSITWKKIKSNW